jgi:ABC1 atypical kinase-like domain
MTPERVSMRKAELAAWLREGLVRLGPTFIKIGQQFSTRVDVLSPEFIKELEKLQDNVPPFSSDTAVQIVEKGLGGRVDEIYEEFDRRPIAAASLGQVRPARERKRERKGEGLFAPKAWCRTRLSFLQHSVLVGPEAHPRASQGEVSDMPKCFFFSSSSRYCQKCFP